MRLFYHTKIKMKILFARIRFMCVASSSLRFNSIRFVFSSMFVCCVFFCLISFIILWYFQCCSHIWVPRDTENSDILQSTFMRCSIARVVASKAAHERRQRCLWSHIASHSSSPLWWQHRYRSSSHTSKHPSIYPAIVSIIRQH